MQRGLKRVRRPTEVSSRPLSVAPWPAEGFSLVEVLAVMAILMLLFVLYWGPSTSNNRQRQARKDCQNQLERIYMALSIYQTDYAGWFPTATNAHTSAEALDALVPRYTADTTLFTCPGVKQSVSAAGQPFRQQQISYAYYMGRRAADAPQALMSDQQVNTLSKAAGEDAFSSTGKPPGNNHGKLGGNFLFCDGRAEASPPRPPFSLALTQGVVLLNPYPNAK